MIDEILRGRLYDIYHSTDEEMRYNQMYNTPHFADMGLQFDKKLYKMVADQGWTVYGYQYIIGNLYAPEIGTADLAWKDKVYMNTNMDYENPLYTPFIVFTKRENGTWRAININKTSVYRGNHGKSYLLLQMDEYCAPEDIRIMLIPYNVKYACTSNNEEEFSIYAIDSLNFDVEGRRYISNNQTPYESVKIISNGKLKMFTGKFSQSDTGFKISGLEHGEKVYIESVFLFNWNGELIGDVSEYLEEHEANFFSIKDDRMLYNWSYIVFYYTEANKSVTNLYSIPKHIIDHDTEVRITGEGKYILGEENFNNIIDTANHFTGADLVEKYRSIKGRIHRDYVEFLEDWLKRIVEYRAKLVKNYIESGDPVEVDKDLAFYTMKYTVNQLYNRSNNGYATFNRVMWSMYDDQSYNGYCDIILFINGFLHMEYLEYDSDDKQYSIDVMSIKDDFTNKDIVELVYITNVRDKQTELQISYGDKTNEHILMADRYYEPRLSNFFTLTPEPMISMIDMDESPTLQQPLDFTYEKLDDNKYNIQFNEAWLYTNVDKINNLNEAMIIGNTLYTVFPSLLVNSNVIDLLDKHYFEDVSDFTAPISAPLNTSNAYMLVNCKDNGLYICNKNVYSTLDGTIIDANVRGKAIITCDNFVKDRIAVVDSTYTINEFDGLNLSNGVINTISINIAEMNNSREIVQDRIIVPYECSACFIEDTEWVVCLENGWMEEDYNPRLCIISMSGETYISKLDRTLNQPIRTIDSKIINMDSKKIIIYGGSEQYHDATNKIYTYDLYTDELILVTTIPDTVGTAGSALWFDKDEEVLFVFGGLNTNGHVKTSKTIARYHFKSDEWETINTNHVFIDSCICESDTHIALVGGYKSSAIDINNIHGNIFSLLKTRLYDDLYLENFRLKGQAQDSIVDARSINDLSSNETLLVGNRSPKYNYTYKLYIEEGVCTRYNNETIGTIGDWNDIVPIDTSNKIGSTALFINNLDNIQYGFSLIVKYSNTELRGVFIDTYGTYHAIVGNHIYAYENGIWIIIGDITSLNEISPLKKIELCSDIFIGLLENGKMITSPDLNVWYDYNLNTIKEKIIDIRTKSEPRATVLMQTESGKVYLNPYKINMSSYYDNYIMMSSKNRFASQTEFIDEDMVSMDVIELNDDFAYCVDPNNFMLFYKGRLVEKDAYKVSLPSQYSAVNRSEIYLKFDLEPNTYLTVLYLTFNTDIVYRRDSIPSNGIITIDNTEMFNKYGLGRNYYWLFSQGKKIPYDSLQDVSNNMIMITDHNNIWDKETAPIMTSNGEIDVSYELIDNDLMEYDVNSTTALYKDGILTMNFDMEAIIDIENISDIANNNIIIQFLGIRKFTEKEVISKLITTLGLVDDIYYLVSIPNTTTACISTYGKTVDDNGNIVDGYIPVTYNAINTGLLGTFIIIGSIEAKVDKAIDYRMNGLCVIQTSELFNTDEFNIDEFNRMMDKFISEIDNFGTDKFYIDGIKSIKDLDISIEDKVILLKIYSDHYVANKDRYGNTPNFELDNEYENYPVSDGN